MVLVYCLSPCSLLQVSRLRRSLQLLTIRHELLGSLINEDGKKNCIMQYFNDSCECSIDSKTLFPWIESVYDTDEELNTIIQNERNNLKLFDLTQNIILRCHLVYYQIVREDEVFLESDRLILNFNQTIFDIDAIAFFLQNLTKTYIMDELPMENNSLIQQYLNCKFIIFYLNNT